MEHDPLLSGRMEDNRKLFKRVMSKQKGVIFRDLLLPAPGARPVAAILIFMEGHVSLERLEEHVVKPLMTRRSDLGTTAMTEVLPQQLPLRTMGDAIQALYRGKALFQISGETEMTALVLDDFPLRGITPPESESSVYGPRESFTEKLEVSLTMIRRRLPGQQLRMESVWIGQKAKLEAVICYATGLPTDDVLKKVRERLSGVEQEAIQDISELNETLADHPVTIFPTLLTTERPDMVVHYMMAGRVAVLMENSPRALIMPAMLMDLFGSPDDFYEARPVVVFLRLLRVLAFSIAIPLPALYVSVTTYHIQALPTQLTLSLLAQREGAPLPPPVEAVIMTVVFEILREAGVRLPRSIGSTVSIVGGLVIGDAAIRSGLTSPAMVLVVSATAVATFSLPSIALANAATYYRFGLLALSSAFGFFGLMVGYLVALANVAGLTSLGVPYTTPLFPTMLKHIGTALGLKPRPPKDTGTKAKPELVRKAEDFDEGKD